MNHQFGDPECEHSQYLVIPFALVNVPTQFQCFMTSMLADKVGKFVLVYLDNIIIYLDDLVTHKEHVCKVLQVIGLFPAQVPLP